MQTDVRKSAESLRAASFFENITLLGYEFADRSRGVEEEDRQRALALTGGDKPGDVYQTQTLFRACRLMYESGTLTMSELSQRLLVRDYTASRLVSWMVNRGLVERNKDPEDGRIVRVALTPKGCQVYEVVERMALQKIKYVLGRLTQDEQIIFTRLLEKLVAA